MAGFDFDGARKAGYSDAEIVQHLQDSGSLPFDVKGALSAGYSPSEIITHLGGTPEPSGIGASLMQGAADVPGGIAKTIKANVGAGPVSDTLENVSQKLAPKQYTPANIVDQSGVHPSNLPAWIANKLPGMAVGVTAYKATPGPFWAKLLAGAAAGTLMSAGNQIQATADAKAHSTPTTGDVLQGDATSALSNVAASLPFARYASGAGPALAKTGLAGVGSAAAKLATTAGAQGAGSAVGNVISQAGASLGSPGGVTVDPSQVADSALGGAALGTTFGLKPAVEESLNAAHFRHIDTSDPEMTLAATQAANRIQQAADGRDLNAGIVFGGKQQKIGAEVFNKADAGIRNELRTALSDYNQRATLPHDANNVVKAALGGSAPTESDYATLSAGLGNDPQAANILNLVRQAHAMDVFKESGHLEGGKFKGGISGFAAHKLTGENVTKTAIGALGASLFEGGPGHIIAYSPEVLAALAGATAVARLGDNLTGARSPAYRITRNFADNGNTPVRLGVPTPPPAPQAAPPAPAPINPLALPPTITRPAASIAKGLALKQQLMAQNAPPAPTGPQVPMRGVLPASVLTNARSLVAGLQRMQKLKAQGLGQNAASSEIANSPYLEQLTGGEVPTPEAGRAMSQALGAARALATLRRDPAAEAEAAASRGPVTPPPGNAVPASLSLANGNVHTEDALGNEDPFPPSKYAGMAPKDAAEAILKDMQVAGIRPHSSVNGFKSGAAANIATIRAKVAELGALTGLPPATLDEIAARFEGRTSQNEAVAYREHLKHEYPQAAAALDHVFSDTVIRGTKLQAGIWKLKGK